jgi:hypothetical protein
LGERHLGACQNRNCGKQSLHGVSSAPQGTVFSGVNEWTQDSEDSYPSLNIDKSECNVEKKRIGRNECGGLARQIGMSMSKVGRWASTAA